MSYSRREFLNLAKDAFAGYYVQKALPRINPDQGPVIDWSAETRYGMSLSINPRTGLARYLDTRLGETILLDQARAYEARERAKMTGELELAEVVFPLVSQDFNPAAPLEKFTYDKPPGDIVTKELLQSQRVTIINSPNVQLSIRHAAFQSGGVLEHQMHADKNLTIVLIDGTSPNILFMNDERYKKVVTRMPLVSTDIEGYRRERIAEAKQLLELFLMQNPEKKTTPGFYVTKQLLWYYQNIPQSELLYDFVKTQQYGNSGGLYLHPWNPLPEDAFIVLPITPLLPFKPMVSIIYHPDGKVSAGHFFQRPTQSGPFGTFPYPYSIRLENGDYFEYYPTKEFHAIIHEFGHLFHMVFAPRIGQRYNDSEEAAEQFALMYLTNAAWKFVSSGGKDTTGYQFVFRRGSQYFITKNEETIYTS